MNQLFRILMASLVVCLAVPPGARAAQSDPMHKEGRGKLSYEMDRIARESEHGGQVKSMSPAYNRAKGTVTVVIELNAGASPDAIKSIVAPVSTLIELNAAFPISFSQISGRRSCSMGHLRPPAIIASLKSRQRAEIEPSGSPIDVTIGKDEDGIVLVRARDNVSGATREIAITYDL